MNLPSRYPRVFKLLLWLVWLVLISAPLVFVRLDYDSATDTWNTEFRGDRWFEVWHDDPLWVLHHVSALVVLALGVAAIVVVRKFAGQREWKKVCDDAMRRVRDMPLLNIGWLRCIGIFVVMNAAFAL